MKNVSLVKYQKYDTLFGRLTYVGKTVVPFACDSCGRLRRETYEFCANWERYQEGHTGIWLHFGSECVKHVIR